MFKDVSLVQNFHVYQYQHLDDLTFLRSPEEVFADQYDAGDPKEWTAAVSVLFKKSGWEGDGDIMIMWFPPFVGVGVHDTHGHYAWIVKQGNNGTSFIASEVPLTFPRLKEQN